MEVGRYGRYGGAGSMGGMGNKEASEELKVWKLSCQILDM